MRTIEFKCTYNDFLNTTGRRNSQQNEKLWLNIVAMVNIEHHDDIKEDICEAIALLANDDI
jgi:hypothetical protein